jgi:hypothetical protein
MYSRGRQKLVDRVMAPATLQVSRRQVLQGAGAVVIAALLCPTVVFGHDDDEALGPFGPWSEPVNLGPVVNSPFDDTHPAISKNGLSLFITSGRPGGVNGANLGRINEIWVAQRASRDDPWGSPQNLGSVINSVGSNTGVPNLSPDEHLIFFNSGRPGGCGGADLYVARRKNKRDDFGWQAPVNLGCTINSAAADNGPTYFADDETDTVTMFFNSTRPGGIGPENIYASILGDDGTFGAAVLVPELSSPRVDGRTAIRRDGLEMLVSSNRLGSIGGSNDIWVSTRATTSGAWSTPVNLGRPINSEFDDGGSALSADGTTLYFYSTRPGGLGGRDLYVATRHRIHRKGCDDDEHEGCASQ